MTAAVLAIDGGNSKTDVALVSEDGTLLGYARGPGSCYQNIGIDATMRVLQRSIGLAAAEAEIGTRRPLARHGAIYLAGADLPVEVEMLREHVTAEGWVRDVVLDNDTFALLRAGTESPNRVAVVCGAGINCVGVSAGGAIVRFPSLGEVSGDWGGGGALGMKALYLAARAEDGRGAATSLQQAVCGHFDRRSVAEVSAAFHLEQFAWDRIHELVPVLLREAGAGDAPAAAVVRRLADEVVLLATLTLSKLGLVDQAADIVLGGGVLAARDPLLLGIVADELAASAPRAVVRVVDDPPVVGAALLGLDALGASSAAESRVRRQLLDRMRTLQPAGRPSGS